MVRGLYGQLMAVTSAVLVVAVGISLWVLHAFGAAAAVEAARRAARADIEAAAAAAHVGLARGLENAGLRTPAMRARERALGGTLEVVNAAGLPLWRHPLADAIPPSVASRELPRPGRPLRVDLEGDVVWASAVVASARPGLPRYYVLWRAPLAPVRFPTPTEVGVMVSGLAAILLAQILWAVVARRLTAPLAILLDRLERYGRGDFSQPPRIRAPAEFMRLADAMARMAQALAAERERRETFLAEVAHDLRTPLTALRSLLGSLSAAPHAEPVVMRERLARAERETDRLARLVNDLLDLARYESGHLHVAVVPLDLREVAVLGAVSGEAVAQVRGVAFALDLPEQPVWVLGDLDRGAQILVNLVDNALRYTPQGGRVRVRVGRDGGQGVVWVEDTGPGFEPDAGSWVWSPFVRGKTTRENDGGTGLGLAVGRALARVMGGDLRILRPAHGWMGRIRLELPLASAPAQSPARADEGGRGQA
ncbi:MAG: HAMP domain-containing histidine kinase [Firmicutes bacterium]|nr:HAMP domain-containing histidine kinase [Bacillota bacterium]